MATSAASAVSRCTEIVDWRPNDFNEFPRFHYTVIALKPRTGVLKPETKFWLKFVPDLEDLPHFRCSLLRAIDRMGLQTQQHTSDP
jgi:hypothetical protein